MTSNTVDEPTWMSREILEIPNVAQRLCEPEFQNSFHETGKWLQGLEPSSIVTIARGSSHHAATCLKYAIELVAGIPVAPIGPSIASIYDAPMSLGKTVAFAVSQSGGSEDLLRLTKSVRAAEGTSLALTNTASSPLALACDKVFDIEAGPENAVAATKSYTNSVLSGLWILAHWRRDRALMDALRAVPEVLGIACETDISNLVSEFASLDRLIVLGRGPTLGIAQECALKAMEVCAIPAAAYSGAEVLHGPSAILKDGYPVLAIGATGRNGMEQTIDKLQRQGARILDPVHFTESRHDAVPALDSLVVIYRAMEVASRRKGLNPDKPSNLKKITDTV